MNAYPSLPVHVLAAAHPGFGPESAPPRIPRAAAPTARSTWPLAALLLALAVALLAGCSGSEPAAAPTQPRAAALDGYASVTLTAPAATDAGPSPSFAWKPVDGAAEYRLAVVGADGPVWAWAGPETTVLFGAYADAPAEGVGALRLQTAAWWSVAAFDADGALLAISDHRAVAPDASVPAPWADESRGAEEASAEASAPLASACDLFTDAEAEAFLGGALAGAGEGGVESDGVTLYCSWVRADDELLTLDLSIEPGVLRESWDESLATMLEYDPTMPHAFEGVGDDSYLEADWGGTRLALIADDVYLSVRSGFTGGAEDATIALATELLGRYQERVR